MTRIRVSPPDNWGQNLNQQEGWFTNGCWDNWDANQQVARKLSEVPAALDPLLYVPLLDSTQHLAEMVEGAVWGLDDRVPADS